MATTNEIVGFQAFHHDRGQYLHFDPETGRNFLSQEEPLPISRADVHRRIAAYIEQPGCENDDDFSVDAVFRQLSPLETASQELGGLLTSLCARHGLSLGLSREQIEAQIAKELQELGAGGSTFVATCIPRVR